MTKRKISQKIKEITEKIVKEFKPEKIILFGSYAWGKPGPDSDVDLLIIKDTKKKLGREVASEISSFIFPRPFPLDIIVYNSREIKKKVSQDRNLFLEDVINNGKMLYARP